MFLGNAGDHYLVYNDSDRDNDIDVRLVLYNDNGKGDDVFCIGVLALH